MARRCAPAAAALLIGALLVAGCTAPRVATITIHYSGFEPNRLTVAAGEPLTIVLVNEDPIDHEWIVGDAALHERHRSGTEPYHAARPTEVTIPALTTRRTTVVFDEPGRYTFICHFPRHEAYGMVGAIEVTAADG